jgi:hypothetical protein
MLAFREALDLEDKAVQLLEALLSIFHTLVVLVNQTTSVGRIILELTPKKT